jgi:sigma-B regulation protein RsbU (phosphoserine phosphatase)
MQFGKLKLQYSLLFALLAWSVIAQSLISGYQIYAQRRGAGAGSLPFRVGEDSLELQGSLSQLRRFGLEPGDELMAIEGEAIAGYRQLERKRFQMTPGQSVSITIRREKPGAAPQMIHMVIPVHTPSRHALNWVLTLVMYTFLPVFSLLLGYWVAMSRPRDKLAWLTLAVLASFSQVVPGTFFALNAPWLQIVIGYRTLLSNTWPLWIMLFGLYFPRPFPALRRHRYIPYLLAVPFVILLGVDFYTDLYDATRIAAIRDLAQFEKQLEQPLGIFFMLCTASFFVSITLKLQRTRQRDARRRMQWLLVGSAAALIPWLMLGFFLNILDWRLPPSVVVTSALAIVLFPLTLAYVIVVQRAMEVRVAIRTGVQYALARGGLSITRIILSISIIVMAVKLALDAAGPVSATVLIGIAVGLLLVLGRLGDAIREWVDRRFFREAYDAEVILTELSQNVAAIRDTRPLLETVAKRISDSLHVPQVAVLLHSSGGFRPAYALGYGGTPAVELPPDSKTVQHLKETPQPAFVYFDDENSWVQRTPDEEREILRMLDAQLLLPLALKNRLMGIISLGPKRSEEPYSTTDMRLLHAVASQTGLALENARLTESIRREIAARARVNRELEIAREVQERLFPQSLPNVEGLDYAGYCRPQQEVGGDYYDFLLAKGVDLGFAVGDVSGKGIAASLTMASLQASLRTQAMQPSGGPAQVVSLMNNLVYDASASNRYATFFYGQYNSQTRMLTYVNAGHNAPVVWRQAGQSAEEIVRLTQGGTVIGLFPEASYQEGCMQLSPGDVLVAYTDGISEAMDGKDEEWGEDRLIQAICECRGLASREMIWHVLERVDAFTAGAAQHDDMTLVVLRVK